MMQHGVVGKSIVGYWTELGSKCEWALVLLEHGCRLYACCNPGGFLVEFRSNKRCALKKIHRKFFSLSLNSIQDGGFGGTCLYMHVCVQLLKPLFVIKVMESPCDLFFTIKEAASEECVTRVLSMKICQSARFDSVYTKTGTVRG